MAKKKSTAKKKEVKIEVNEEAVANIQSLGVKAVDFAKSAKSALGEQESAKEMPEEVEGTINEVEEKELDGIEEESQDEEIVDTGIVLDEKEVVDSVEEDLHVNESISTEEAINILNESLQVFTRDNSSEIKKGDIIENANSLQSTVNSYIRQEELKGNAGAVSGIKRVGRMIGKDLITKLKNNHKLD